MCRKPWSLTRSAPEGEKERPLKVGRLFMRKALASMPSTHSGNPTKRTPKSSASLPLDERNPGLGPCVESRALFPAWTRAARPDSCRCTPEEEDRGT
ncbi:hypothetical protein NDU88_004872 [Pleurodeles waltl]|uniref:Uncharacterized protein n=1 Tax=Pleurodeles waltl TaxID=8319 RepID=A0AAV7MW63_PLEWA|nr:hypothetical protein NDU88_004872 [Pleurodeles waltl]